ncbi:pheophorbide a oxygenase, chloroplastic-like [Vigna umbellata]|uniref:pheophorbide a oxygenase, chloroplastic-like n=1 Tax=Vigna umbellata TaxID=87088 RepID=UPI001F5E6078|nr:pheophorbide a oxygenase, chloroplastic-like [Vigna umbellata]
MQDEMKSLHDNHTYDLVKLSKGKRALENRWIFRVKQESNSTSTRYKARGALAWQSKLQKCVALSTIKAKFIALTEACKELLWVKKFMEELGFVQGKYLLYCDSQNVIHLGKNPTFHSKSKHIDVRYARARIFLPSLDAKLLELAKVHTDDKGADMMTKALPRGKFEVRREIAGLVNGAQTSTSLHDQVKPDRWSVANSQMNHERNPKISAKFVAPCYYMNKIEIDTKLAVVGNQKWVVWICSFNVPMAPGKTRSIVCSARNFFQFTVPGPAWWQVVPRWYEHWTSNKVYDGDMIVLQGQEKIFLSQTKEGGDINKQYTSITFTPTQADRFVLAFREWLRRQGNGQPEWFANISNLPLPSTVLSKREMLDRFEQHTLKCSSCKGAYEGFQIWQKVLIGATVMFCATSGIPADVHFRVLLAGLAIVSAALAFTLNQLQKNFEFVDYVHAEIE